MTDDRATGDRGPLAGLDAEAHIDGEVIDLSDNSGPELTTDVDDWAPSAGSDASRSDGAAVRGEDAGSAGGVRRPD